MSNSDTEHTVVTNSTSSGAGWFVAGIAVVVLGIGAYMLMGGELPADDNDIDVKIDVPDLKE